MECLGNFLQHSEGRMVDVWQHQRQNPKKMPSKKFENFFSEVKMIGKKKSKVSVVSGIHDKHVWDVLSVFSGLEHRF